MKITMIGHATMYVETDSVNILFDPILFDPHQEGLLSIYPARYLDLEKLPEYDLLVLSHRHLDHFDVRSLSVLPKDTAVIIPKDDFVEQTLRDLGFSDVTQVNEFAQIDFDGLSMFTTRSENRVPEYGVLLKDKSGVFWNQVDSIVSPATVQTVLGRVGHVDYLLASWQPMLETATQFNGSTAFPVSGYGERLQTIGMVRPGALSPGANAFRYDGDASWLNSIVFPVSRERFLEDAKDANPGMIVNKLDPGDVVLLNNGKVTFQEQASTFVGVLTGERDAIQFDPVGVSRVMVDETLQEDCGDMLARVQSVVGDLSRYLSKNWDKFSAYRFWGVTYQMDVLCAKEWIHYSYVFGEKDNEVVERRNPAASMITKITATSLVGLSDATQGWDRALLGGFYRHFTTIYKATSHGVIAPADRELADPLEMMFPYPELFEKIIARQIRHAKQTEHSLSPAGVGA